MATAPKLKSTEILREATKLARKYPKATYEPPPDSSCSYLRGKVTDGPRKHGCIVGQAIRALDPDFFKRNGDPDMTFGGLMKQDLVTQAPKTAWILDGLQMNQDAGMPWGEAFADVIY